MLCMRRTGGTEPGGRKITASGGGEKSLLLSAAAAVEFELLAAVPETAAGEPEESPIAFAPAPLLSASLARSAAAALTRLLGLENFIPPLPPVALLLLLPPEPALEVLALLMLDRPPRLFLPTGPVLLTRAPGVAGPGIAVAMAPGFPVLRVLPTDVLRTGGGDTALLISTAAARLREDGLVRRGNALKPRTCVAATGVRALLLLLLFVLLLFFLPLLRLLLSALLAPVDNLLLAFPLALTLGVPVGGGGVVTLAIVLRLEEEDLFGVNFAVLLPPLAAPGLLWFRLGVGERTAGGLGIVNLRCCCGCLPPTGVTDWLGVIGADNRRLLVPPKPPLTLLFDGGGELKESLTVGAPLVELLLSRLAEVERPIGCCHAAGTPAPPSALPIPLLPPAESRVRLALRLLALLLLLLIAVDVEEEGAGAWNALSTELVRGALPLRSLRRPRSGYAELAPIDSSPSCARIGRDCLPPLLLLIAVKLPLLELL